MVGLFSSDYRIAGEPGVLAIPIDGVETVSPYGFSTVTLETFPENFDAHVLTIQFSLNEGGSFQVVTNPIRFID